MEMGNCQCDETEPVFGERETEGEVYGDFGYGRAGEDQPVLAAGIGTGRL